jgi:REP element-mobilizing transposase RayT
MPRTRRLEIEDGWVYVTNRGQGRQAIFLDAEDGEHFLQLAAESEERFGVETHAYVLLPDHYHLLVRTPRAGLSRAIHRLDTAYGLWWNRRHARVGHVFQGRYKGVVVEDGPYLLELSLHLHANPGAANTRVGPRPKSVELPPAGSRLHADTPAIVLTSRHGVTASQAPGGHLVVALTQPPEPAERPLADMRGYRWSSYRAHAGYQPAPAWLHLDALRALAGGRAEDYRRLAEERLRASAAAAEWPAPYVRTSRSSHVVWRGLRYGVALGGDEFAEGIRQRLLADSSGRPPRYLRPRRTWAEIVAAVEEIRGEVWAAFRDRHGDAGRDLAWWAARRHGGMTLREVAEACGTAAPVNVAVAVLRLERRAPGDDALRAAMQALANRLAR